MTAPRNAEQKAADDKRVSELRLRGKSQRQIVAETGLNLREVNHALKRVRAIWLVEYAAGDHDRHVTETLARLFELVDITRDAYDRSIGEIRKEARKVRRSDRKGEPLAEVTVFTETLNGDPRYLALIAGYIQQIRELLGLDAPKRTELSGPGGGPIQTETLTPDQAAQRITDTIKDALKTRKPNV